MVTTFLSKPYPLSESTPQRVRSALFSGFFIFAFLFVFRPFQLHRFETLQALSITGGYGLVSFLMILFNVYVVRALLPRWFDETKWTVGREIGFILWIIFTIGLANAAYSLYIFDDYFSIYYLLYFQFLTLLVAILPVTLNVMIMQLVLTRKNLKAADDITSHMHHKKRLDAMPGMEINIRSDNQKETLSLPAKDLLYITSADNYIEVHFVQDGKEHKKLLRGTLKNTREDLRKFTAFYRCHRAWIVNLDRVVSVTGNSQGYRLIIDGSETVVPVSRNLNEEIHTRLAK